MAKHAVKIHTSLCIGCGLCAKTCAAHNIVLKNKKAETILDDCILCGQCSAVCPKEAVTISGYDTKPITQNGTVHLNPHEVLDVIRFRRTIRQFQKKEIPHAVLEQILEAGRLTHTAKNMQDVSFVVLEKEKDACGTDGCPPVQKTKALWRICSVLWPEIIKYTDIFSSSRHLLSSLYWQKIKQTAYLQHKIWSLLQKPMGWVCCYSGFFTICRKHFTEDQKRH